LTLGDIRLTASTNVAAQLVVELTLASLSFDIGRQERATRVFDPKLTCDGQLRGQIRFWLLFLGRSTKFQA